MHSNHVKSLVTMANQIGQFFETMKDRAQSLEEIALHLKRFWEPRLRRALLDHVERHNGTGLTDIVLESVHAYRDTLASGISENLGTYNVPGSEQAL